MLLTASPEGKEIGARLALRLGSGFISDAVDVAAGEAGEPAVVATQSVFAASFMVRSAVTAGVPVIAVKPNATSPVAEQVTRRCSEVAVELSPAALAATVTGREVRAVLGAAGADRGVDCGLGRAGAGRAGAFRDDREAG